MLVSDCPAIQSSPGQIRDEERQAGQHEEAVIARTGLLNNLRVASAAIIHSAAYAAHDQTRACLHLGAAGSKSDN
jgi:hypothetical protein